LIPHDIPELSKFSLDRKQEAMADLGVVNMVMVLISKAREPANLSEYVKIILPEVMQLGSNLCSLGIQKVQNKFLEFYYTSVSGLLPSQYFLVAIRELLRVSRKRIGTINTGRGDPFFTK
jgi:hypothetical protein